MRRHVIGILLGALGAVVVLGGAEEGCAFDWTYTPGATADDARADAVFLEAGTTDAGQRGGGDGGGTTLDGSPTLACKSSAACLKGSYCRFVDNNCGAGVNGQCEPFVVGCVQVTPSNPAPEACACDGTVHGNVCDTSMSGLDVSTSKQCNAPPGTYRCGTLFCDAAKTFCRITQTSPGAQYECDSLGSCMAGDCTCIAPKGACTCDPSKEDGGVIVICN